MSEPGTPVSVDLYELRRILRRLEAAEDVAEAARYLPARVRSQMLVFAMEGHSVTARDAEALEHLRSAALMEPSDT